MSLAIKNGPNAIAELKIPSPQDVSQGNVSLNNCKNATIGTKVDCHGNLIVNQYLNVSDSSKSKLYNIKNGINGLIVTDIELSSCLNNEERFRGASREDEGKKSCLMWRTWVMTTKLFGGKYVYVEGQWFSNDSAVKVDWKQKLLKLKYVWGSLIFAVVITTVFYVLFFPQRLENDFTKDVALPYNYTLRLRTRPEWFSPKPEVECKNLTIHPAKFVIVGHTVTTNCFKQINCENVIKGIQTYHLKQGYCDIAYNFIVAGDGYIYEGIGWGKYGAHTFRFNCDSIGVAFLGNYNLQYLTPEMEEAFHLLIDEGLKLNEISPDYKLFGRYQVSPSESPGINIKERMKKWKHWNEINKEDFLCEVQLN